MSAGVKPQPVYEADDAKRWIMRCVFCLKTQAEVQKMIESDYTGARICDECVGLCVEILAKD